MYIPNQFGINISVSPYIVPRQKIKLSPTFTACSNKVRDEMNQWLLDMFGTEEVAYLFGDHIAMNPRTFAMLRGDFDDQT